MKTTWRLISYLLATQQSIKAYVDSQVATADALSEVLGNGNTTGGTDIAVGTDDITFADSSKAIFGAGSDLRFYNGSHSFVEDTGTGDLRLLGDRVEIEQNLAILHLEQMMEAQYLLGIQIRKTSHDFHGHRRNWHSNC